MPRGEHEHGQKCLCTTNWLLPWGTLPLLCSRRIIPSGSSGSSPCPPVSQVHSAVTYPSRAGHIGSQGAQTSAFTSPGASSNPGGQTIPEPLPRARANPRPPTTILPAKCAALPTMLLICYCVTSVITDTIFIASPPPSPVCRLDCGTARSAPPAQMLCRGLAPPPNSLPPTTRQPTRPSAPGARLPASPALSPMTGK